MPLLHVGTLAIANRVYSESSSVAAWSRISVLVWANETLITRPSYSNQDPQLLDVVDADDKSSSETGTDCEDEEVKIEGDFTGQSNRLPEVFPSYSHLAHSVSDLYHEGSSTEED